MGFILLLLFYLLVFIDRFVGKRIEPSYDITDSDGSVKYRVGIGIFLVLLLIGIIKIGHRNMDMYTDTFKWFLIFMLILFWGFQSFMEWKYVEGKKYRLTLFANDCWYSDYFWSLFCGRKNNTYHIR